MAKFRKKPVVVEATQWFKNGDHPDDGIGEMVTPVPGDGAEYPRVEGRVVSFHRHRGMPRGELIHPGCQNKLKDHGWVATLEGGHIVCPGDWIITGIKGEHYPCKPDIFEATYGPDNGPDSGPTSRFVDWSVAIKTSAENVLKTGGVWLGDMTEQASTDFGAASFMIAMENLKAVVDYHRFVKPDENDTPVSCYVREGPLSNEDAKLTKGLPGKFAHQKCLDENWDYGRLKEASIILGCSPSEVVERARSLVKDGPRRTGLREMADEFLGKWMLLPPLVRASAAISTWTQLESAVVRMASIAAREKSAGMERRSRVTALHAMADGHVADFMVKLVNHADGEAAGKSIDADVRYQIDEAFNPLAAIANRQWSRDPKTGKRWTYEAKEELEKAVEEKLIGQVQLDIDKDVMGDLTKAVSLTRSSVDRLAELEEFIAMSTEIESASDYVRMAQNLAEDGSEW